MTCQFSTERGSRADRIVLFQGGRHRHCVRAESGRRLLLGNWTVLIVERTDFKKHAANIYKEKNQHLSHEVFSTRETESSGLKRQLSLKKYSDNINVNCGTIQLPVYYFRLMQQ